jgi:hypothetical protein
MKEILIEKLKVSRHALSRFCRTKTIAPKLIELTSFLPENSAMNIRCWHIINEVKKIPKCKHCEKNHTKFNNNKWGYLDYCSVKCQRNSKEVKENLIKSYRKKYGENIINPYQAKEVKEKIKHSLQERYGVDHNFKSETVRNKIKETNIEKYGVDHFSKTDEFKEKYKESIKKKYGVDHFSKTDEFKEKSKNTWFKKYGVEHPMKDPLLLDKFLEKIHKFKDFEFPSGKIVRVQGYEDKALKILLEEGICEDDILVAKGEIINEIGIIEYFFKDKNKFYFPDFFIKSLNMVIEVKSTWTFDNNGKIQKEDNIIFAKRDACISLGYKFRIMII